MQNSIEMFLFIFKQNIDCLLVSVYGQWSRIQFLLFRSEELRHASNALHSDSLNILANEKNQEGES